MKKHIAPLIKRPRILLARLCAAWLLCLPLLGQAQPVSTYLSHDEAARLVLRAIDYAELQRALISRDCGRNPEAAQRLPACAKIVTIPGGEIERLFLPHFIAYVSEAETRAALQFWSSTQGTIINRKQLLEVVKGQTLPLSPDERQALEDFNSSPAGQAMMRLAQDVAVAKAVIAGIGSYTP